MKKILSNKILILFLICMCAVIAITVLFMSDFKGDNGISVLDFEGQSVAEVCRDGDGFRISALNDDYSEYVDLAVKEAIDFYAEKFSISDEEKNAVFFENISKITTYFVADHISEIKEARNAAEIRDSTPFACAIVSHNGEILAVYGAVDSEGIGYSQKKTYAGSSIKPLSVYAPLIETGKATCSTVFQDAAIKKVSDGEGRYTDWPENASGDYSYRKITVYEGLCKSLNTIAVRGLLKLSVAESVSFLEENFGINLEYEKATMNKAGEEEILGGIALGYLNEGVSPVDMAGYYEIFAGDGTYIVPHSVLSVETVDGNVISAEHKRRTVISPVTSSIMREMLKGVISRDGTAYEAYVEDVDIAGKSGTSDGYADNWFVGFTTEYICSVWHGYNDAEKNSASKMFSEIISRIPVYGDKFILNENVVRNLYCKKTGMLKGKFCDETGKGVYNPDFLPERCNECG